MSDLTGRVRHRTYVVADLPWRSEVVLVLQVEERNPDFDQSPYPTRWRDAKVEDFAQLPNLYTGNA